eukprot:NODE_6815_length_1635_cov_12.506631.p1 GENE.NODE_6815_length_1635_cov_12.506631~~NODE_6815_length_1635_cov_12.506631.p1  ORF type:complete len:485 (-),score=122.63 NODE_6815_length_1635_cov_12.506631:180-1493(-)
MLALYVNGYINRLHRLCVAMRDMQTTIQEVSLKASGALITFDTLEVKWALYRYLNLYNCYTYLQLYPHKIHAVDALINAGLLKGSEGKLINKDDAPMHTVFRWLCHLIMEVTRSYCVEPHVAQSLISSLTSLREVGSALNSELMRQVPISYKQLMHILVMGTILLTPPTLAATVDTDIDTFSAYFYPLLGSVCVAIFYDATLQLAEQDLETYRVMVDRQDTDYILLSTERRIFDFLAGTVNPIDIDLSAEGDEEEEVDEDDVDGSRRRQITAGQGVTIDSLRQASTEYFPRDEMLELIAYLGRPKEPVPLSPETLRQLTLISRNQTHKVQQLLAQTGRRQGEIQTIEDLIQNILGRVQEESKVASSLRQRFENLLGATASQESRNKVNDLRSPHPPPDVLTKGPGHPQRSNLNKPAGRGHPTPPSGRMVPQVNNIAK